MHIDFARNDAVDDPKSHVTGRSPTVSEEDAAALVIQRQLRSLFGSKGKAQRQPSCDRICCWTPCFCTFSCCGNETLHWKPESEVIFGHILSPKIRGKQSTPFFQVSCGPFAHSTALGASHLGHFSSTAEGDLLGASAERRLRKSTSCNFSTLR